ncbi:MAG TPA: hypothetical protein VLH38_03055 [Patescibacteria group bacterium]|nr:hypothetical protein [Patescibacteria group bacterium]
MTIQEYLDHQLQTAAAYELTPQDHQIIADQGLEAYLYTKLTSKKFRKWALDESSEVQARHALHLAVATGKPIPFRCPFGGYKLWRIPTAPTADWADFFAIATT